ncbi:hypothetical protein V1288_005769 [Bradyrhizobium sp. AZCC 2176]
MHSKPVPETTAPQVHCLASNDPQIAFANEVVAAMKNRLAEGRAMAGMPPSELP